LPAVEDKGPPAEWVHRVETVVDLVQTARELPPVAPVIEAASGDPGERRPRRDLCLAVEDLRGVEAKLAKKAAPAAKLRVEFAGHGETSAGRRRRRP